ncbi:Parallel beta helix pectate lyase-like protein [Vibrio crassostreae]|uniref:hypothetical protein n=1 Tax=Vibrio crassostreae TaxID=246167 RepID=UPI0010465855|nr:hypothetical protein [Vibrio crassostreae]TCN82672.1 hypothetical protein EDB37_102153 [Vibrio crassostreae]CAK2450193.1 Parallel beta helix pectate lyase-like protein [Vibrio crassostreae]CAK3855396.1 Parallel beta helix pectate lyase-like protein [Vibrio crassostreae]
MQRREFIKLSLNAAVLTATAMAGGYYCLSRKDFKTPSGLGLITGPLKYKFNSDNTAQINSDLSAFYPKGYKADKSNIGLKVYYVDSGNGTMQGDGLSWETAMKSINVAIHQPDVDAVLIAGGKHYGIDDEGVIGMGTYSGNRDVALIAVGEPAIISSARKVRWSSYRKRIYSSSNTGGQVHKVIDISREDKNGNPIELRQVISFDLLNSDTFFFDEDRGKVFVRLSRRRTPDENILCLRQDPNQVSAHDVKWYARNIKWYGASRGALRYKNCGKNTITTIEDCHMGFSTQDGLCVRDVGLSIARRCSSFNNDNDAFNYHEENGLSPHGIEESCKGYNSKQLATGNGSTSHENCRVLRVNCEYYKNKGPGIADIQTSKTYNVAVTARDNYASNNSWGIQATDDVEIWLHKVSAFNNSGDNKKGDVVFSDNVKAYVKDLVSSSDIVISGNVKVIYRI